MSSSSVAAQPKIGPHFRMPWNNGDPSFIRIHRRYDELLGTYRQPQKAQKTRRDRYDRAKRAYDLDAAFEIVDELLSDAVIDRIIDDLERFPRPPRILMPHPEWDAGVPEAGAPKPTNALPFAYASILAEVLGGKVETEIIQIARPGRTKLKDFQRFIWQPRFDGPVLHDCAYILVDDVCHFGGTLAALRSHIVANGGTVVSATALACNDGKDREFPIADRTIRMLKLNFEEALDKIWREEIGHDTKCLTEPEGSFLLQWRTGQPSGSGDTLLQRVREELAKARAS